MQRHAHVTYAPGPLRQYRFPVGAVVRMGNLRDEQGEPQFAIESHVPPRSLGVVIQTPPKRRPSYRQRHNKRRHRR